MKIRAESKILLLSQPHLMSFPKGQNWDTERESLLARPRALEDTGRGVSATGKGCPYLFKEAVTFQSLNFLHFEFYFLGNRTNINYWACVAVCGEWGLFAI